MDTSDIFSSNAINNTSTNTSSSGNNSEMDSNSGRSSFTNIDVSGLGLNINIGVGIGALDGQWGAGGTFNNPNNISNGNQHNLYSPYSFHGSSHNNTNVNTGTNSSPSANYVGQSGDGSQAKSFAFNFNNTGNTASSSNNNNNSSSSTSNNQLNAKSIKFDPSVGGATSSKHASVSSSLSVSSLSSIAPAFTMTVTDSTKISSQPVQPHKVPILVPIALLQHIFRLLWTCSQSVSNALIMLTYELFVSFGDMFIPWTQMAFQLSNDVPHSSMTWKEKLFMCQELSKCERFPSTASRTSHPSRKFRKILRQCIPNLDWEATGKSYYSNRDQSGQGGGDDDGHGDADTKMN
jgi:hypothetical protein